MLIYSRDDHLEENTKYKTSFAGALVFFTVALVLSVLLKDPLSSVITFATLSAIFLIRGLYQKRKQQQKFS